MRLEAGVDSCSREGAALKRGAERPILDDDD